VKPTPPPGTARPRLSAAKIAGRIFLSLLSLIVVAAVGLYVTLLLTPIPLPFVRDQARDLVFSALPPSSTIEMGDVALALEGGTWPVLQFRPVTYTDSKTGATVRMSALEIGFSPVRALIGQPGITVTIVEPLLQINQDLFGPRLATFDVVSDSTGGPPTVRVLEGADAFPEIGISAQGVEVSGNLPTTDQTTMRSDNDWLLYNIEAAGNGIAAIAEQAELGRFSRLIVRDGKLEMNDALYGLFRTYDKINIDIMPRPDNQSAGGPFSARFGAQTMNGIIERTIEADGSARLKADIANMDFASFMPFIDDSGSIISVEGAGALSMDMHFGLDTGRIIDGTFRIDMTGTELRVHDDFFPVVTSIIQIDWKPADAQFTMAESEITIGKSSGKVTGVFVLGLDRRYGPIVGMSINARDVSIAPNDLPAPTDVFTAMAFEGWSAPLYGATGIDLLRAEKPDAWIETKGRADVVRQGLGFTMTIVGEGFTADDMKRLWPYFISGETREWVVANVGRGRVERSTMKFGFPIGTIGTEGEDKPLPPDSVSIDMVANDVEFRPLDTMIPVAIEGKTRLWVRDGKITVGADGATVATESGNIDFANAAMVMDSETPGEQLIEISGDVRGGIPAIMALAKQQQPEVMAEAKLPLDLNAVAGTVNLALVSTIVLDETGQMKDLDYAINGSIEEFGSTVPIETHTISGGQLSFVASQEGYRIAGQAQVDGISADLVVEGRGTDAPTMLISSMLNIDDLKTLGFDTSEFLTGRVKFVGKPMPDGALQLAVDIADAALNIKDLGISKAAGVPGLLEAEVKQTGTLTELTRVSLTFGNVNLKGSMDYDLEEGLVSADFTTFQLSPGDAAEASLTRIADGYQMRLRGEQLDLKPMLNRFFGLGSGSGGPQATVVTQTIVLDVQLQRALGFYRTTAFNLDLDLTLRGSDMQKVNLQAQLGGGSTVSVTTNPGPQGRILSVAFNDFGTLLRLVNVYANVEGGAGSLVLQANDEGQYEVGQVLLRDFAIVDEANLAQIMEEGNQSSRVSSGRGNMYFRSARLDLVRRKDRVEVVEGLASGDDIGITMRGFIYTDGRQYDLTGTYVPLFGINNMFQKLPILGPLIGGREGEGLLGVTFAVRGPLDKPDFQINPVTMLLPGVLRGLFEYRAKEQPRVE
jgi:hypothetical protein